MTPANLVKETSPPRQAFFREHQQLLAHLLSEGQNPQILFIGCDDSRVIPEAILGADPGDLFVLRSLANVVPPFGTGESALGAAVEYGLRHLKIKHIIICGHTDCGGVQALDTHLDQLYEPHLARWIDYARPAQTQVDAWGVDPDSRHRAIVEHNVLLQLEHLQTYDVVRHALNADELTLHGWVYDLTNGRVSYWDADVERFVDENDILERVTGSG